MEVSNAYIEHIYQLNYPALVGQLLSPTIQPEERDAVLKRLLEMNQVFLQQKLEKTRRLPATRVQPERIYPTSLRGEVQFLFLLLLVTP